MLKNELSKIFHLDVPQRLMIVEAIWDSIVDNSEDIPLSEDHIEELEKRLNAYHENPQAGSPWNTVKERILARN
jgi:putative addiction module component (TIGR02574 family)